MILEVGVDIGIKNLLKIKSKDSVSILDPRLYAASLTLLESFNNKVLGEDINIFSLAGFKLVFYNEMITLEEETQPLLFYTIIDKNANVELVRLFLKRLASLFMNKCSLIEIFFNRPSFFNNFKLLIRDILDSLNLTLIINEDNIDNPPDSGSKLLSDLFIQLRLKILNKLDKNKAENMKEKIPDLIRGIEKLNYKNQYLAFSELLNEIKGTILVKKWFSELLIGIIEIFDEYKEEFYSLFRELVSDFTKKDLEEVIINLDRKKMDETLYFFLDNYFLHVFNTESIGYPLIDYLNGLYDDENDEMINLLIKTGYIFEPLTKIEYEYYLIDLLSRSPEPVVKYVLSELNRYGYQFKAEGIMIELIENARYSVIEFLFYSKILQPVDNIMNEPKDSIISSALKNGNSSILYYLINEGYFDFEDFSIEVIEALYINSNFEDNVSKTLLYQRSTKRLNGPLIPLKLLWKLLDMGSFKAKVILLEEMKKIIESNSEAQILWLVKNRFLNYYDHEKKIEVIYEQIKNADYQMVYYLLKNYKNSINLKKLEEIINNSESKFRKSLTVALLNRKIANTRIFPMLKKLSDLSYSNAQKILKKEILKRMRLGNKSDFHFFFDNYYLSYFTSENFDEFLNSSPSSIENLIKVFSDRFDLDFQKIYSITLNSKTTKYEIMLKEIRNELILKKCKMSEVIFNLWLKKLDFYIKNLNKF